MREVYHVTPINDILPHDENHVELEWEVMITNEGIFKPITCNCICLPKVLNEPNGNAIVIHNAWDNQ